MLVERKKQIFFGIPGIMYFTIFIAHTTSVLRACIVHEPGAWAGTFKAMLAHPYIWTFIISISNASTLTYLLYSCHSLDLDESQLCQDV